MDNDIAENIVIYDWLSFTSKQHTPEQLIEALGLSYVPWVESKGARGYRSKKYFSSINIHYDGRDDVGVWGEMSGQGCRTFETLSKYFLYGNGWENLFHWIQTNGCKRILVLQSGQQVPIEDICDIEGELFSELGE